MYNMSFPIRLKHEQEIVRSVCDYHLLSQGWGNLFSIVALIKLEITHAGHLKFWKFLFTNKKNAAK